MKIYGNNSGNSNAGLIANITTITETTAAITPDNNTEYRCGEVTSVTITLPEDMPDDYAAYIVFTSGTTAAEAVYPDTIEWSGDDVIDGVFIPVASRRYNIGIWYDGVNVNAVARGAGV